MYPSQSASPQRLSSIALDGPQPFLLSEANLSLASASSPDELKNKTVCEDQELKLHCHESKFLNIYSVTYGRRTQQRDICSSEAELLPPFGR